ncbi:MAG TPA: c-type cytochrome [Bryobacteraceae bacterium]|jgi:cytochrome c oxidase cbb3-type subunit 3|nr:c-type cytochrome [Bryobacteraceae bacterium]
MCFRFHDLALFAALALTAGCRRSSEQVSNSAQAATLEYGNRLSDLIPGGSRVPVRQRQNPYEGNVVAIGEGQKLYNQYNCSGCHFKGGGGIGPALMDDKWIYGSSPAHIYSTIVEGRPNGMPAFGGRIVDDQIWKITAYVRSLSGLDKKDQKEQQQQPISTK